MKQALLCVYHAHCDDGFGAAWSVRHAAKAGLLNTFWDGKVDFWPAVHAGKRPDVFGRDVVMLDFCYPKDVMDQMVLDCKSMLILDHHKSSMLDMMGWEGKDEITTYAEILFSNNKGKAVFDMTKSGAMLAWEHFHPLLRDEVPWLIKYIQDNDLWTHKLTNVKQFVAGLRSYPMDFEVWDQFEVWDKFEQLLKDGAHILRYKDQLVEIAVKNSFWVEIDVPVQGMPYAPAVQTLRIRGANVIPAIASEVGEAIALRYGGRSLTWIEGYKWTYSLRSRPIGDLPAFDVSQVAAAMGGGGHAQAAGFKSTSAVHRKWFAPTEEDVEDL